jgi:7-cyano-7-deazaguanine reductase
MNHGDIPLGKAVEYVRQYDPKLLFPMPRAETRASLNLSENLPFRGSDQWTAYEISWLDNRGKPQVAMAEITVDANSPNIVESKSLKLYLNSYNQSVLASPQQFKKRLLLDLTEALGAEPEVKLLSLSETHCAQVSNCPGQCLDDLEVSVSDYSPKPELLAVDKSQSVDRELLYSHLLKTNCPVTGQPDWATLWVEYSGCKIYKEGLLAYLISFREHQDFHENCVERIYCDLQQRCQPDQLTVYARYTRRGGLDINPLRTNAEPGASQIEKNRLRTVRQ